MSGYGGGRVLSDQDIVEALESISHDKNLTTPTITSFNGVVQHLEAKLGLDLSHKIDFIHSQIQCMYKYQLQQQSILHLQHQNDPYALHQNPGFHPQIQVPPPASHLGLGFRSHSLAVPHPQQYVFLAPSRQQLQGGASLPAPTSAVASKDGAPGGKRKRGGSGGLNKICGVSPELQTIVGQATMPRTEIVKQLWAYIRKHSLQDPSNRKRIICNDELRLVFETDCTDMFKMNKLLTKHIIPLEPTKQTAQNAKKTKAEVDSVSEGVDSVPTFVISEALANFFCTEGRQMSQAEVLKQMWEYIKTNQLEDPFNSMVIMCDKKLQELFGCESISALGVQEMLARKHLFRKT